MFNRRNRPNSASHINSHILPPTFILRIYIFTPICIISWLIR